MFACDLAFLWASQYETFISGISDGFWEYRLKPWDCAAGVLMVQEAGGIVTTMTGEPYTVFHRYWQGPLEVSSA